MSWCFGSQPFSHFSWLVLSHSGPLRSPFYRLHSAHLPAISWFWQQNEARIIRKFCSCTMNCKQSCLEHASSERNATMGPCFDFSILWIISIRPLASNVWVSSIPPLINRYLNRTTLTKCSTWSDGGLRKQNIYNGILSINTTKCSLLKALQI